MTESYATKEIALANRLIEEDGFDNETTKREGLIRHSVREATKSVAEEIFKAIETPSFSWVEDGKQKGHCLKTGDIMELKKQFGVD